MYFSITYFIVGIISFRTGLTFFYFTFVRKLAYGAYIAIGITITIITIFVFVLARIAELTITKISNVRLKTKAATKEKKEDG